MTTDLLQLATEHGPSIIAAAAALAAILPRSSDANSPWGAVRKLLDAIGMNWGNAANHGQASQAQVPSDVAGALRQAAELLERLGQVEDRQRRPLAQRSPPAAVQLPQRPRKARWKDGRGQSRTR